MAKTVIVSGKTIQTLIEAHASMAAWYYQMAEVLREAGLGVHPPSGAQRKAYVEQLGQHFPELATAAKEIDDPRPYVPRPVVLAPPTVQENAGTYDAQPPADHLATPAPIAGSESEPDSERAQPAPEAAEPATKRRSDFPAPPALVDPKSVKFS